MFEISGTAVRTMGLNKLSYIDIMIFAINTFFKIIGKNNNELVVEGF